jgi:2-amino-4-hydroxy-6-hydroxymethyldihydropteridine diphosphokinase
VTLARAFIALGGNQGDRPAMLTAALDRLAGAVKGVVRSPVYETAPKYVTDQPAFLNMVIDGRTELPPEPLLDMLKAVESDLGRVAGRRYGPRPIDLDILFYDDLVLETARLTIPHPRIHERRFVLQPLADIAPSFHHPASETTVAAMLAALPDDDDVRLFEA